MRRGSTLLALVFAACGPAGQPDAGAPPDASAAPTLFAAARIADITPPPGVSIVGFGVREATAVRDPLEAAVLVLREGSRAVAIVTIDLPGIPEWHASLVRTSVASRIGASYDDVIVAASHTHSAPMLGDDAWSRETMSALVRIAADARASLGPVSLAYGEARISFDVNRRLLVDGIALSRPNPDGPRDPRARVIALEAAGELRAVLTHVVCHPNILRGVESTVVSADFPGEARRALADLGAPWLYVTGSAGDVRPNIVDGDGEFRRGTDEDLVAIGGELASATRSALEGAVPLPAVGLATAHTTLVLPRADGSGERTVELSAVRIGRLVLLTIPGEPLVAIGLAVEARVRAELDDVQVLVLGYTNGYADYIVTEEAARYGGYEVERAVLAPQAAVAIEDALVALAISLF